MRHATRPQRLYLLVALLAFAPAGCISPYPYSPFPPRVSEALGTLRDRYADVCVYYATDRRPTGDAAPTRVYGGERGRELHFGVARVSIPAPHGRGRVESPGLLQAASPERHVKLLEVAPSDRAAFVAALRDSVGRSAERGVLVFVHGYANQFGDSARRTAQLAHDVSLDGAALAYSWPTQGWTMSYLVDAGNVEWTVPQFVGLLNLLVDESGAEQIHILAHSMGCRVLCLAVREFVRDRGEPGPFFGQIVLAAADVDAEIFERDYADALSRSCQRLTVYSSTADWALGGSQTLHRYARLGTYGPPSDESRRYPNLDVIDATRVDKGAVGHFYYGNSPTVLADLQLLLHGLPPSQRGLARSGDHWRIEAPR